VIVCRSSDTVSLYYVSCIFAFAYLLGDDAYGRKVIVLSACRLPAREDIDHEKLLMLVCTGNT